MTIVPFFLHCRTHCIMPSLSDRLLASRIFFEAFVANSSPNNDNNY